jgi:aspartate/methionine/tyrosine aminotransferase
MHKHSDKFHYFQPKAGTICFPALKESFCNSAEKFCAHLIAKHGILLVPGIHFG